MSPFRYRAVTAGGEVRDDVIEAASREAAAEALRAGGLIPIRVTPGGRRRAPTAGGGRRIGAAALADASRQLATLIGAGLPLERSLQIAAELSDGRAGAALDAILAHVRAGRSLADAMAAHGGFDRFHIGLVRAGEASGTLDQALVRLADHQERTVALKEEIQSAMVYPAIVLALTLASIVVMFTAVVPQFRPLFENAGDRLPAAAQAILMVSDAVERHGLLMALGLAAALLAARFALADPRLAARRDALLLKTPLFGPLVVKAEAARFARALGVLLGNGVAMTAAMAIARDAVANAAVGRALDTVAARLAGGGGLAAPMRAAGLFPPVALHLARVGEETGRLDSMLVRAADILDADVGRAVKRAVAVLVPALTVILGVIVAVTVGAVLTAILSVYDLAA